MDMPPGRRSVSSPAPRQSAAPAAGTILGQAEPEEINLRVMQPIAWYVQAHHGELGLEKVANACGIPALDLIAGVRWASCAQCEAFLSMAMELFRDEQVFREACTFRLKEASGPMRLLLLALSPKTIYARSASSGHMVSAVGRFTCAVSPGSSVRMTYTSSRPESRLMCQSRMAQLAVVPTLCGLAMAEVAESGCIARGDPACEYHIRWKETGRWLPVFLGLAAGLGLVAPAVHFTGGAALGYLALPALGAALGYAYELRRIVARTSALGEEVESTVRLIAREDAEARREIMEFHQRQREWSRLLEEQVADRTDTLRGVLDKFRTQQEARVTTLRGFSHDLRTPMNVLKIGVEDLMKMPEFTGDRAAFLEEMQIASQQLEKLVAELMETVLSEAGIIRVTPQKLEVQPLADRLRRRLRALVHGRDIRVSAFATREAPEFIETDLLLFDRVVDNLLTNAAKYTDRGSIVIEVDGSPGFLTIKVSDTGRGISDDVIERIFQPRGSGPRGPNSYGVGLSVVVQLLAQIGGRVEVMSKPGVGSTFWAHIPVRIGGFHTQAANTNGLVRTSSDRPVPVVTIRRSTVN